MYEIRNTSGIMAYADEIRYITQSANGSYIQTDREHANGIAFQSTPYHLIGTETLSGAIDDVSVEYVDSGIVLTNIIPFKETKTIYYGEKEKTFYGVPQGNVTVFWNNYNGNYSVQRIEDRITVSFDMLTVDSATITIMIQ